MGASKVVDANKLEKNIFPLTVAARIYEAIWSEFVLVFPRSKMTKSGARLLNAKPELRLLVRWSHFLKWTCFLPKCYCLN